LDIRELPISVHKTIIIGPDNWAFRCPDSEGLVPTSFVRPGVLDHFEENAGRQIPRTDGYYELRFNSGSESGPFIVDCPAPCSQKLLAVVASRLFIFVLGCGHTWSR
jgi:hypothetical protein